ncbi:hypothetical protein DQ04_00371200 [Trypanosoma grayi]|uniref:hypothetical protein n=1 Tax=Trypanosoma grayi TaxID=71804 RepID=UPI0004F3F34B|nr:hypothetical protein DQ04_00371200 [Trypanosoma grayi]KEG14634.1 hypothetical protein DQ04_00371200 [Trypanosoma grayi]
MVMLKVWLREPHQSNDEAIKLVVDETADVSDVLLKVPELLRVQHLKPSEIQAEYKDSVLSNRLAIVAVFEGANEGTLVIRPRPGVVIPSSPSNGLAASGCARGGGTRSITSGSPQKGYSPPSPRTKVVRKGPGGVPEPPKRTGSFNGYNGKPPVARSSSRGPTPPRGVAGSTPRGITGSTPRSRKQNFSDATRDRSTSSRIMTPRRDVSVSNSDPQPQRRQRHIDPKDVVSRFRQEAEKVRVTSKKKQLLPVCDSFKPQWGKPLCATCNHSKQAHWVSQKRRDSGVPQDALSDGDITSSDAGRLHNTSPDGKPLVGAENSNSNNNNNCSIMDNNNNKSGEKNINNEDNNITDTGLSIENGDS